MFTQSFVRNLVNGFKNPEQRMSFITYSTDGHVNMQLTSDRNKINTALVDLFHVIPSGTINMQHGLKKANEQIERTRAAGERVPSLIIALTGGPLLPESFAETKVEAEKSRQLGATLYLVGVQDYQKYQLLEIARTVGHALAVDTGYSGLEDIIDPLIVRSCVEITSVDFSSLCTRGKEIVKVIGKGFQGVRKDDVVCQFRTGKETIRMKAVSVEDTSITCPGLKMSNLDWAVFIDVSLDNGLTFIETDLDVSRRSCVTPRVRLLPPPGTALSPFPGQGDTLGSERQEQCPGQAQHVAWAAGHLGSPSQPLQPLSPSLGSGAPAQASEVPWGHPCESVCGRAAPLPCCKPRVPEGTWPPALGAPSGLRDSAESGALTSTLPPPWPGSPGGQFRAPSGSGSGGGWRPEAVCREPESRPSKLGSQTQEPWRLGPPVALHSRGEFPRYWCSGPAAGTAPAPTPGFRQH
ncbi:anthrax toxin receptor-like isoform X3 [Manis pentadactyla]|nr:anthrax toxin receptor-like isoform X3 [Manis pentadactyla]